MDKGSVVRTILLVIALINQVLVMFDLSPIPFSNEELEMGISTIFTAVVSLIAWWKNNYISKTGRKQKEVIKNSGL